MKTIEDFMRAVDPMLQRLRGSIRRMAVTLTNKALWQVSGFTIDGKNETFRAEPFTGIGISARPPEASKSEAIVQMIGDANTPTITAVRDEKTRQAVAGSIKPDETMLYNSKSFVHAKDTGKIEVGTPLGVAQPTIRGTTYREAEDTLVTALTDLASALSTFASTCVGPTAPQLAALTGAVATFNAAANAFKAAGAAYLTAVLEVE